ncbi:hypothetical protein AUJ17_03575 [Candidatus Micrarchaeota archaeon CG1_02_47_40]|nr:MAG: hypothetical protein AUJ17_03575 [Candidatus Micrarchaeota archaeon CG1_02_47_40]
MPIIRRTNDPIRLHILKHLFEEGAISPNISLLQKLAKLNQATIRKSLSFLKHELSLSFSPQIDLKKTGFPLETITLFCIDIKNKKTPRAIRTLCEDAHTSRFLEISGFSKWNYLSIGAFRSIEHYISHTQRLSTRHPYLREAVADSQVIYIRKKPLKNILAAKQVLTALLEEEKK